VDRKEKEVHLAEYRELDNRKEYNKNIENDLKYEIDELANTGGITEIFDFIKEVPQKVNRTNTPSREDLMKSSFAVFLGKYEQEGSISKYFYSFDLIRQLIFSIILVSFEGDGYEKAIAITIFNFIYLSSCILIRPYNQTKLFIETIFTETIFCICSLLICVISKEEDLNTKENIGMALVVFNGILTYTIMIIQAKEGIFGILSYIWKICRGRQSVAPK
jgi:hypothetical protein